MTVKTYRYTLPKSMGGTVVEGIPSLGDPAVILCNIDGHTVPLPAILLTTLLPLEPRGGFVFVPHQKPDQAPHIFYRDPLWTDGEWWEYESGAFIDWAQVCDVGTAGQLVAKAGTAGTCQVCGVIRPLRIDGMIHAHGARNSGCQGSGRPPAELRTLTGET